MKIPSFNKLVSENLTPHSLKDCTVVIDGQNYLYRLYEESKLPYTYGCESDNYADYLRKYLDIFKRANVDCYFIFKGGHENKEKMFDKYTKVNKAFTPPIFMKEIYKQVLEEMGFNYTICTFESKKECIAFAQKNNCPVISNDTEFCFSSITYIPYTSMRFNEETAAIDCGLFTIGNFMLKYQLTKEKMAMFVAVTSEIYKCIPREYFYKFQKLARISTKNMYERNVSMLNWLRKTKENDAEKGILQNAVLSKYFAAKREVCNLIEEQKAPGIPTEYLENENKIEIADNDPLWFDKGVAAKHIAIPLVNLFHHHTIFGSPIKTDIEDQDAVLLSIEIIKYISNLLTNFERQEITFYTNKHNISVTLTDSVQKPNYIANHSAFENGWMHLPPGLFEHFLTESLQGFEFEQLDNLPEDSKLLMITLTYFSRKKKDVDVSNEVYCVLLSYTVLSANIDEKRMALHSLRKYLEKGSGGDLFVSPSSGLFPLVEFQHCLEIMNYLNKLCGKPYQPTVYSKTYNGTLVYKMLRATKSESVNFVDLLESDLAPVTNVLDSFRLHVDIYRQLIKN
ncbi:protein asteroid homolog 1-like [Pectinophora gossypiella]|uniref:XPG N-terminal domain-containing protein n=1 Tax=Pectinophora gossypiella TaxID=13191 RepID=A0A1E1WMX5_PECGO|nr:protein asteroid homolog 1-like [Pectinophora gossypiella]